MSEEPADSKVSATGRNRRSRRLEHVGNLSIKVGRDKPSKSFPRRSQRQRGEAEYNSMNDLDALPEFSFSPLNKPIHWDRLKCLRLDRYIVVDVGKP